MPWRKPNTVEMATNSLPITCKDWELWRKGEKEPVGMGRPLPLVYKTLQGCIGITPIHIFRRIERDCKR